MHAKTAVFLFLAVLLLSVLPTLAWSPAEHVAIPGSSSEGGSGAEVQWVPSGSYPGFYAARDNANLDPVTYQLVGGHQSFYWDQLEPAEGVYRFDEVIEPFIRDMQAKGKRAAFGILTYTARGHPPVYRVPSWVVAPENHHKIVCSSGGVVVEIPRYWDSTYKTKYRNFIRALAQRYDGDRRVEFIQIGVGKHGETQPCDDVDDNCVEAALRADGFTKSTWAYIVNDITNIYADNFRRTKLILPNAPTFAGLFCDRRIWTDHAIQKGVGLMPAEMYAVNQWVDHRNHIVSGNSWNGCGVLDRILDQAGTDQSWVPIAFEGYDYMVGGAERYFIEPDPVQFFWAVAGALSRHPDYITLERNVLYCNWREGKPPYTQNLAAMSWAKDYLGKHINETPSVWVLMRETGYKDDFYPQKGNYSFWLTQDDSLPGGRTVPTTYLPKSGLVLPTHWSSPTICGDNGVKCVNPAVEVGQSFLRGAGDSGLKEGWICRRTRQETGDRYMWFKIDDRYRNARPGDEATITVVYLDRGTDTWRLEYDSASGTKATETVTKGNSGRWRTWVFNLTDAALRNGLSGADFRLDCMADGNEYIHMVDVRIGAPLPTATPTATRSETDTPTLSPTPSTPTITPNVTSAPRTITIKPGRADGRDTYIVQYEPNTNYGADPRLKLRALGTTTFRTLIRFDTSAIPSGSRVQSAKLYLRLDWYDGGRPDLSPRVSVYKVKRDWVASEATWNSARSGELWQVAGCDGFNDREMTEGAATVVSTINTWYIWDITNLVGDWVANPAGNKGMLLISSGGHAGRELRFYSADGDTQYNPYLVVTYIEGGGPITTPTATPTGVVPTNTPSVEPSPVVSEKGASRDTYLDHYYPTTNYEHRGLRVYGFGHKKALLNFDLSDIPPGARISSATLQLTTSTAAECTQDEKPLAIGVYKVNKPWVANQATWNLASSGVPWAQVGCNGVPQDREGTPASITTVTEVSGSGASQVKRYTWDVTRIVQAWVNDPSAQAGLVLLSTDGAFRQKCFYDSVYGLADRRPLLRIVWRPPPTSTPTPTNTPTPGTPTPTLTPSTGAIEGTVFEDMNLNGRRDAGEPGLGGVTVELWQGDTRLGEQITVGSGSYRFEGLAPGLYTVKEIDLPGYLSSTPNEVANVAVFANRTTSEIDFGDYDPRVVTPPKVYVPIVLK